MGPGKKYYVSSDGQVHSSRRRGLAGNASAEEAKGAKPCQSRDSYSRTGSSGSSKGKK